MSERKVKISQQLNKLQKATGWESDAVKQLIDLLLDDARHKLVSSEGDDTLRLQGEARAFERLSYQLRHPSPVPEREQ